MMTTKEIFQNRKENVKKLWTCLFIISAILTIILIIVKKNDKEVVYYEYLNTYSYYTKDGYYFLFAILAIWDICCIFFWFCSFFIKFDSYDYNGHDICVYLGMNGAYLLIDDEIVDKSIGSISEQPLYYNIEGEEVWLKVGFFSFNNYTLRVGNKILH